MPLNRCFLLAIVAGGLGLSAIGDAFAQSYPRRPVTLITPFAAGGGVDVVCRLVGEKLREILGQQFVVENRTAGGGNVGAEAVARAAPDGHTLLCAPDPVFMAQLLYSKLSFDPQAFEPVSVFARLSFTLVGRENLPISNLAELIAYARAHPGNLNWASPGVGQTSHLILEALRTKAKIDLVHVPYRGVAPALIDLLAGQVDLTVASLTIIKPYVTAGRVKLLAVASPARLAAFPDTPTLSETVTGLDADALVAIAAPPGTPSDITDKLSAAIAKVAAMPDVKARFAELQTESLGTTPVQMRDMIRRATEQGRPVIAAAGIHIE